MSAPSSVLIAPRRLGIHAPSLAFAGSWAIARSLERVPQGRAFPQPNPAACAVPNGRTHARSAYRIDTRQSGSSRIVGARSRRLRDSKGQHELLALDSDSSGRARPLSSRWTERCSLAV
jgi:hypothetical protein